MTDVTIDDCKAALRKHGSQRNAAQALGISRAALRRRIDGAQEATPKNARSAQPAKPAKGRSLSEFRSTYDKDTIIPSRIDAGIEALGKEGWVYEMEFIKIAGVGLAQLSAFRDAYADFIVQLNRESKRAWAGSKALAAKMRSML